MKKDIAIAHEQIYGISRACRVMELSRSVVYYKASEKDYTEIEDALLSKAEEHPSEGFWKAHKRLKAEGVPWNHKPAHKAYVRLGLPLRRKKKRRLPQRAKLSLEAPKSLNHTWSIDFMEDRLENGKKVRCFNVLDDGNRECLHVEIDQSLKSGRIVWVLNHLISRRSKPKRIRMDNGPEFIAKMTSDWSKAHEIEFLYTQPGCPTQNAYVERFNGSYRRGVLNAYIFETLGQVREISETWLHDYNHVRPHDSLGDIAPVAYGAQLLPKASLGKKLKEENEVEIYNLDLS